MTQDRTGLQVLVHNQCPDLLNGATFRRIGLLVDGLPVVLPVNFMVADDHVVVHTVRGSKLAAATRNALVAIELDEFDMRGVCLPLHDGTFPGTAAKPTARPRR